MKTYIGRIILLAVLIFLLAAIEVKSQSPGNLPRIIPPSPVASAFTIYGDYPVSFNTGIPDIQIPLYNFQCGDIEVPIVLKYHIGSAKPNQYLDEMSNIGYGWILEAGGIITRTVYGKQDESGNLSSIKTAIEYNQESFNDYNTLQSISNGNVDSEYDIFKYSFTKGGGDFVIRQKQAGKYNVYPFPYVPWKWDFTASNSLISSVKIKDDKGYDYIFSDIESHSFANSGWFLSQINSPNNRSVNFTYNNRQVYIPASVYYNYRYDVSDFMMGYNVTQYDGVFLPNQPVKDLNHSTNAMGYQTKTIKQITSVTGKVVFTLNTNNSLILNFTVFDSYNNQIRKVTFFRHLFSGQSAYNQLDSLWIQDSNNTPVQTYKFQYNTNSVLDSRKVDYWGWYNGTTSATYVPTTLIDYFYSDNIGGSYWHLREPAVAITFGEIDRCVDQNKILAQTLKKIIYPTGGSTEFVFEPNQLSGSTPCNDNSLGEGLRIKSIINKDPDNTASTKTYVYQPGSVYKSRFDKSNYVTVSYSISGVGSEYLTFQRNRSFNENLNSNISDNGIRYNVIDEYFGTITTNIGKNTYYYNYDNPHIYTFHSENIPTPDYVLLMGTYRGWGNGLLNRVETYRKESNLTYTKIKEKSYSYEFFNDTIVHSLRVIKLSDYPQSVYINTTNYNNEQVPGAIRNIPDITIPTPPIYGVYDYNILTGGYLQKSITETDYLPAAITTVTENFYEDGNKKYVTKIVNNRNSSFEITKRFSYPYDNDIKNSDPVYTSMVNSNRIDNVIELLEEKNGSIQKTRTNYHDWGSGIYAPQTVQATKNSGSYEDRIVYSKYDNKGNILDMSRANDFHLACIWGYNQSYPVVKIDGVGYDNIPLSVTTAISGRNYTTSSNYSDVKVDVDFLKAQLTTYMTDNNYMVTICTYKPLVGMTSQTDQNGITTFYEYDTFGRVKAIKDNDNRILKTFEYHYKH
jgi:YD repeat-containing protein